MSEEEKSESGAPIYRYEERDNDEIVPPSGEGSIDEISAHIEAYVGSVEMVFHELVSDLVHIDIHWVKPTEERPYHTLVTSGMSDLPMNAPEKYADHAFAELSICLPPDWKISQKDFEDENNYWPVRWLKMLARFPHEYNTWISFGHTIPNGDPAEPFGDNTKLNTMVLLPSIVFDEKFSSLKLPDKTIMFYTLIPLYSEEVELKMKKGVAALFDGFDRIQLTDVLKVDRPNSVR